MTGVGLAGLGATLQQVDIQDVNMTGGRAITVWQWDTPLLKPRFSVQAFSPSNADKWKRRVL
ncbi:MAG: hypothetical protein IPJ47_15100 [Anaerolineales bacterium]|nr:hypothetical protein [Anaerolineales bacterium]